MILNDRQLGTVLAALRYYQSNGKNSVWDIATNSGAVQPLSAAEIDDLCEALNFHPSQPTRRTA